MHCIMHVWCMYAEEENNNKEQQQRKFYTEKENGECETGRDECHDT